MRRRLAQRAPLAHEAHQLGVGGERDAPLGRLDPPPARQRALHQRQRTGRRRRVEAFEDRGLQARFAQQLAEALRLLRQDDDAVAARHAPHELEGGGLEAPGVGVVRGERDAEAVAFAACRPAFEVGARRALIEFAGERLLLEVRERRLGPEVMHGDELVAPLGGERVLLRRRGVDGVRLVDDHERARPEVVEQGRGGGQRPVARGCGQLATPDGRELLRCEVVQGAASRGREVAREVRERVAAREPLAGWADAHLVDAFDGALRVGVEAADRLHLVAEELDAHRRRLGGREDVDEAAAPRGLPRLLDERADLVPGIDEARGQVLHGDAVADSEACRTGAEVGRAGGGAGDGGGRGDHERRGAAAAGAGEPREHVEAALRDRDRRILARVGESRARREDDGCLAGPRA